MLSNQIFLNVIDASPLVSIDLVIRNSKGEVLLGKRTNKPAQGFWFVPGGRVLKGEQLNDAFKRLCCNELALKLERNHARMLGVYEHFYDDNFLGVENISTHYIVLGYEITLAENLPINLDQQHSEQRWWSVDSLLNSDLVHANTKAYFYHD